MKQAAIIPAADVIAGAHGYDTIIDARSPGEFAIDHLPGAINLPVLSDDERAEVGLINQQRSSFEANRLGAAMVSANIARHLAGPLADRDRHWHPLIYCWRGGNRSGALATVLARIGWHTGVIEGGYKAWRRAMLEALPTRISNCQFNVLAGRTGSGKSRLLKDLLQSGAQVLDLEELANHRGSVLGLMPQTVQPSQKRFESLIWENLDSFDLGQSIWVESESRKIGALQVPESLILKMRAAPCVHIDLPVPVRCELLIGDYDHFIRNPQELQQRLERILPLHGHQKVRQWRELIESRRWPEFVSDLLRSHYDPAYDRSMARNYRESDHSVTLRRSEAQTQKQSADQVLDALAQEIIALAAKGLRQPSPSDGSKAVEG